MSDASPSGPPGGQPPGPPGPPGEAPGQPPAQSPTGGLAFAADWPSKAADTVVLMVAAINDRAVRPVLIGARAVVFGVLVLVLTLAVVVWLSVGFIRLLDVYAFPGRVWASYLLLGVLFCALGALAWSLRTDRRAGAD